MESHRGRRSTDPRDAVRVALPGERPIAQMWQDHVPDLRSYVITSPLVNSLSGKKTMSRLETCSSRPSTSSSCFLDWLGIPVVVREEGLEPLHRESGDGFRPSASVYGGKRPSVTGEDHPQRRFEAAPRYGSAGMRSQLGCWSRHRANPTAPFARQQRRSLMGARQPFAGDNFWRTWDAVGSFTKPQQTKNFRFCPYKWRDSTNLPLTGNAVRRISSLAQWHPQALDAHYQIPQWLG